MLSPLDDLPMSEVMEMLAGVANKHDLALSINLINFADDIYKIAYERGAKDEREACAKICERTKADVITGNAVEAFNYATKYIADTIRARGTSMTRPMGIAVPHRRVDDDDDIQDYKRPWVGLTDEEIKDIVRNMPYEPDQDDIRAIEAKLKVKNHDAYPTEQLSVEEMVRVLNVRTQRLNSEQPLDKV